jgi:hypothetical protein
MRRANFVAPILTVPYSELGASAGPQKVGFRDEVGWKGLQRSSAPALQLCRVTSRNDSRESQHSPFPGISPAISERTNPITVLCRG